MTAVRSRLTSPVRLFAGSPYRRSGSSVLATAIAGPVWSVVLVPLPGAGLTVGRGLVILSALLLLLDVAQAPAPRPHVPRLVWMLAAALAVLWLWIVTSTLSWGCRCSVEVAGFSELAAVCVLAAFISAFEPRLRSALVLAIVAGASLSAALTLAGVHGLSEGAVNPSNNGRAAGPYGNPNLLAFLLAFGVPAALAAYRVHRGSARLALAGALALVGLVLVLSFSRSGLLAAGAGAAVVLVLQRPRGSRGRKRALAGLAMLAVTSAVLYPVFAEWRRDASPSIDPALRALDLSGWDGRRRGLVPVGWSRLTNPTPTALQVETERPGQGISRSIGHAATGRTYELSFVTRTITGSGVLRFGLEDNRLAKGTATERAVVSDRWQTLRARWRPTADSPDARLYIWSEGAGSGFVLRDVKTVARGAGGTAITTTHPVQLSGSRYDDLEAARRQAEARAIASRRAGIELSIDAFESQPVRGIGWGRFIDVAAARTDYGRLPTHNEYLRFVAELGMVGVLLLGLLVAIIGYAARQSQRDDVSIALLGLLATGAVGLLFVNGLGTAAITTPLALAVGLACGRVGAATGVSDEATAWWPVAPDRAA